MTAIHEKSMTTVLCFVYVLPETHHKINAGNKTHLNRYRPYIGHLL